MPSIVGYYNGAVQELSNANLNDLYDTVLENLANTTFAGSLIPGEPVGNSTLIGYFTDTSRAGGPGSSNITILSNTYAISQYTDLTQATPSPNVISLVVQTPNVILQESQTVLTDIADEILLRMVTGYGVGSYYLGNTIPVGDTGVWQNMGQLDDTLNNFTELNNVYFLWKKISTGNAKNLITPLKLVNSELSEFTSGDLDKLTYYIEQQYLATGVGTYVLDSVAPGVGTWANVGVATDFIRTAEDDTYNTDYTAAYEADYVGPDISYSTDFVGTVPASYTGAQGYTGSFASDFQTSSTAPFNSSSTQSFASSSTQNFNSSSTASFNSSSTATFSTSSTGSFSGPSFSAPATYTGNFTSSFSATFTGFTPTGYLSAFVSIRTAPVSYEGNYVGPTGTFTRVSSGFTTYVGPGYAANFLGPGPVSYVGPTFSSTFTSNFSGPGPAFSATYIGNYTGPSYTGNFVGLSYTGNFIGPTYTGDFTGPSYLGNFVGPTYTGNFVGILYTGNYTGNFTGEGEFAGFSEVSYTNEFIGNDTFVTPFTSDYTAAYNLQVVSPDTTYAASYTSASTQTSSSATLWVRIA